MSMHDASVPAVMSANLVHGRRVGAQGLACSGTVIRVLTVLLLPRLLRADGLHATLLVVLLLLLLRRRRVAPLAAAGVLVLVLARAAIEV